MQTAIQHSDFVHLHVHSEYSFPDGACRIKELVQQVKHFGQKAVALTDKQNLYGAVIFYQEAVKIGIQPIIGCELRCTDQHSVLLLCQNQQGYRNLVQLVSLEKPLDFATLRKYSSGLFCLSVFSPETLTEGNFSTVQKNILQYQTIFGKENYFLEIQQHHLPEEKILFNLLLRLSEMTNIPLVAGNSVNYLRSEDAPMQKILTCIRNNQPLEKVSSENAEYHLKSSAEMENLFSDFPEILHNTKIIADRCHFAFTFHEWKLPHFVQEGVKDNQAYFEQLCQQGLFRHYGENPPQHVKERLQHEIQVIQHMGFTDYFLIVQDFVRYARQQEIPVGPGRGSAAGSLCAYCLDITEIDPIAENLLFERFLNAGRKTMPDIDIDFCIEGRMKVKDYVVRRYGKNHVAEIISIDTLKARAAVKDTGKVLNMPESFIQSIVKLLDSRLTIAQTLEQSDKLKNLYQENSQVQFLLQNALKIEGFPRHTSVHAAGIVITEKPITNDIPVCHRDRMLITQYTMTALEDLGFLKIDFLGLRNLTLIQDTEKAIRKQFPEFSLKTISTEDSAVYALLASGKTSGVFQLESDGMKNFLTKLKPVCMEDLLTALAIYRPGPMDSIPDYLRNRQNPEKIVYLHPILKKILQPTYGCMLYQEQVMQICQEMANYSYTEADNVRRAMAKKKMDIMQQEQQKFLDGAKENHIPETIAMQVFSQMQKFAEYAFNRSHAAAYAKIAYQTAYLKTHYFGEYMAALLTSTSDEQEKFFSYLEECRQNHLVISPPEINSSEWNFVFQGKTISFGLLAVKGLGKGLIDKILFERRKNGNFRNFSDFCERTIPIGLYSQALDSLIRSGTLDSLGENRKQMLSQKEKLFHAHQGELFIDGQMSLFGAPEQKNFSDFTPEEKFQMEKNFLGIGFSSAFPELPAWVKQILHIQPIASLSRLPERTSVRIFCCLRSVQSFQANSGMTIPFFQLKDSSGSIHAFPLPKVNTNVQQNQYVFMTGKISRKAEKMYLLCDFLQPWENFSSLFEQMFLCLKITHSENLQFLPQFCRQYSGKTKILFYYTDTKHYAFPEKKFSVALSSHSFSALCQHIPAENIGCIPKKHLTNL